MRKHGVCVCGNEKKMWKQKKRKECYAPKDGRAQEVANGWWLLLAPQRCSEHTITEWTLIGRGRKKVVVQKCSTAFRFIRKRLRKKMKTNERLSANAVKTQRWLFNKLSTLYGRTNLNSNKQKNSIIHTGKTKRMTFSDNYWFYWKKKEREREINRQLMGGWSTWAAANGGNLSQPDWKWWKRIFSVAENNVRNTQI